MPILWWLFPNSLTILRHFLDNSLIFLCQFFCNCLTILGQFMENSTTTQSLMWSIYEIIHIRTAVVDEVKNDHRSSNVNYYSNMNYYCQFFDNLYQFFIESLYPGQFTLSAQLIKPNYLTKKHTQLKNTKKTGNCNAYLLGIQFC